MLRAELLRPRLRAKLLRSGRSGLRTELLRPGCPELLQLLRFVLRRLLPSPLLPSSPVEPLVPLLPRLLPKLLPQLLR